MEIRVVRIAKRDTYTIGRMYLNGVYFCDTLEDKVRDLSKETKIREQTAIPAGTYRVIMRMSPRFKRTLPALDRVPHFEGVLIHRGNSAKDTAGCILVGRNTKVGWLSDSTVTEEKLCSLLINENEIYITVL